jgi:hypothetical protein
MIGSASATVGTGANIGRLAWAVLAGSLRNADSSAGFVVKLNQPVIDDRHDPIADAGAGKFFPKLRQ